MRIPSPSARLLRNTPSKYSLFRRVNLPFPLNTISHIIIKARYTILFELSEVAHPFIECIFCIVLNGCVDEPPHAVEAVLFPLPSVDEPPITGAEHALPMPLVELPLALVCH
jgi:hypothetical protein